MQKLAPQAYSLLPRLDNMFFLARALGLAVLGIWVVVNRESLLALTSVLALLGVLAVHLVFFLLVISRKRMNIKRLYYSTLIFDLLIITLLVRFTGGFRSDLLILYYLFLPFATHALGSRVAVVAAFAATGFYFVACATLPDSGFATDRFLYMGALWVFCVGAGYYSKFGRQSENRLLNALDKLNERTTELERAHGRLALVYEVSRDLGTILKVEDLIDRVLHISYNLLGYPSCELLLLDQKTNKLMLHGRIQGTDTTIYTEPQSVRQTPVFKAVLESGEARRILNPCQDRRESGQKETFRSQLVVPMTFQGKTVGVLNAQSPEINAFNERDEHVFAVLANSAAMALENAILHQQMEQLTISDELTGVFNYRYFKMRLEDEKKRSVRYGQPLSLIMIDIDWFKRFNDTYGHETGNRLLKDLVHVVAGCVRDVDIVARYGGEEFIVILPQTGQAEAYKIGERIRKSIADARFEVGPGGEELAKVTVSVGISCYPENGRSENELVESVDQALYRAKGAGKNLVCTV